MQEYSYLVQCGKHISPISSIFTSKSRTGEPGLTGPPVLYFCEVKLEPAGSGLKPIRPEAAVH